VLWPGVLCDDKRTAHGVRRPGTLPTFPYGYIRKENVGLAPGPAALSASPGFETTTGGDVYQRTPGV